MFLQWRLFDVLIQPCMIVGNKSDAFIVLRYGWVAAHFDVHFYCYWPQVDLSQLLHGCRLLQVRLIVRGDILDTNHDTIFHHAFL